MFTSETTAAMLFKDPRPSEYNSTFLLCLNRPSLSSNLPGTASFVGFVKLSQLAITVDSVQPEPLKASRGPKAKALNVAG